MNLKYNSQKVKKWLYFFLVFLLNPFELCNHDKQKIIILLIMIYK